MENNHIPKLALQCQPHGKRDIERARRRWRQQDHLKASYIGQNLSPKPTTLMIMMMMMCEIWRPEWRSWYSDSLTNWMFRGSISCGGNIFRAVQTAPEATQPPVRWVPRLLPGVKAAGKWC